MKLVKYLVILIALILMAYGASWYYVMNRIATEINDKYAGKKHLINGMSDEDYHATFTKASPSGFPFKFQLKIKEWKEVSKTAVIEYSSPIYIGYDILSQKIAINYDGQIISEYKPVGRKFGARFEINNYIVTADLPITSELIDAARNMQDPFEIVNHIGQINVSTKNVGIFDLNNNGKFYDKEYERFKLTFQPAKKYTSLDDFLQNIPSHYTAEYVVKTNPVAEPSRRLPVSLFYGFYTYPSDCYAVGSAELTTKVKTFKELAKDMNAKVNFKFSSPLIDISSGKVEYTSFIGNNNPSFEMNNDIRFKLKEGAFDELFSRYMMIKPVLMRSEPGKLLNAEIEYIIKNKEAFRFNDLEDVNYEAKLKAQGSDSSGRKFVKIDDMSIFSEKSGFRLSAESTTKKGNIIKGISERMQAEGVLFVQNYPSVVEFSSGYIYRFGKFRFLSDEARDLYVKVNKKFLKKISDHPDSTSNDLSFEFEIDSNNYGKMKFGSVELDQISEFYQNELFKELVDHVGIDGDFEARMKKIIPDLNLDSPVFNKVLPKLKKLQKSDSSKKQEEIIKEQLTKSLPDDAKKAIEQVAPDGFKKKINKELWKNMLQ